MQSDWFNAPSRFPCCALLALSCHVTQMKIQVQIGWVGQSTGAQCAQCYKLMEVAGGLLIPDLNSDWFEDPRQADLWMGETFFDETKFPAPGYSADYNPSYIFCHCSRSFGKHETVNRFLRDQSCVKGWTRLEKFGSFSSITVGIVLFGLGECITGVAMEKTKSHIEKPKFSQKDDQYMLMWSL